MMESKGEFVVLVPCLDRFDNPWRSFDRFCMTPFPYFLWLAILPWFSKEMILLNFTISGLIWFNIPSLLPSKIIC